MPAAYDAAAALERIEHELIDSMMRNLRRHLDEETDMGFDWEQWQVLQLKHLETYRKKNLKKYGPQFRQINLRIKHAIQHARVNGQKEEEKQILKMLAEHPELKDVIRPTGNLDIQGGSFFKINEQKLDALVKATENDLTKAEHAVLRRCNDQYRKIIFDAQMYANTGAGTVEKAIDMATHDFIARGIDSIVYKNGSRHTISDYADMAIRTANRRATLMGAGEMRKKYGRTLVIVNRRGTMTGGNFGHACPQCIPWLGKILIDDVYSGGRPDGKHQLVSTAMQQGFLHPRCKDSFHTYYPGITSVPDPVTKKELEAGAAADRRAAERQKAVRMVKMNERLAEFSFDPENKRNYEARAELFGKRVYFKTGPYSSEKYFISKDPLRGFKAVSQNDAVPFARRESKSWIDSLSENAKELIERYTYNPNDITPKFFERINSFIRNGYKGEKDYSEQVKIISDALKKSKLQSNYICYRGSDHNPFAGLKVGDRAPAKQFLSTSIVRRKAFNGKYSIIIYAPKGTNAAYIEGLSHKEYAAQREMLFDKDVEYEVLYQQKNVTIVRAIP